MDFPKKLTKDNVTDADLDLLNKFRLGFIPITEWLKAGRPDFSCNHAEAFANQWVEVNQIPVDELPAYYNACLSFILATRDIVEKKTGTKLNGIGSVNLQSGLKTASNLPLVVKPPATDKPKASNIAKPDKDSPQWVHMIFAMAKQSMLPAVILASVKAANPDVTDAMINHELSKYRS